MKLSDLLIRINIEMESLKGCEFDDSKEFYSIIEEKLNKAESDFSNQLEFSPNIIRLIREKQKELNGKELFKSNIKIKRDVKNDNPIKGIIEYITFEPVGYAERLMNVEFTDLQKHFDRCTVIRNVKVCERRIENLKRDLEETEKTKRELIHELNKI